MGPSSDIRQSAISNQRSRCFWARGDQQYLDYHDQEWGVPIHDDRRLFEHLVLGGAQAGLSWATILKKRDNYRAAFCQFDAEAIAQYGPNDVARLLADAGIVRNRLKIESAIKNAQAMLPLREEFGSFDRYLWDFMGGKPKQNAWTSREEVPALTPESNALSKDLKARGFKFVGSTICYAFMQAVGLVNDHLVSCFRYAELSPTQSPRKKRR